MKITGNFKKTTFNDKREAELHFTVPMSDITKDDMLDIHSLQGHDVIIDIVLEQPSLFGVVEGVSEI